MNGAYDGTRSIVDTTLEYKDMIDKKPFIAGGYTQEDWDILNGSHFDIEFYDDYCDTPQSRTEYIAWVTKPKWT